MHWVNYIFFGAAIVVAFISGFLVGRYAEQLSVLRSWDTMGDVVEVEIQPEHGEREANTAPRTTNSGTIETSDLSPGQRRLMETFGIDADNVEITPAMIACAEAKLGVDRVAEIRSGATPSFTEGLSLATCYKTSE